MIFFSLFIMFARIGAFSFGGGYAMLPLIFQSVQDFGVMSSQEFSNLVALSQITPGPVAVNAATYVGFNYAGIAGAAAATLGVTLPSFIIVMLVSGILRKYNSTAIVEGAFTGIRPATVGLIASAAVFLAETSLFSEELFSNFSLNYIIDDINWLPCGIFLCTIVLVSKFKLSPIIITIIMGVIGALLCG